MKEQLQQLMNKNSNRYADFIKWADTEKNSMKWGMGVLPAYTLEPYYCELLGYKPGRMLKKEGAPAKNRQCYYLDNKNRIICELEHVKYFEKRDDWMIARIFFVHDSESINGFKFGASLESRRESSLAHVVMALKHNNLITKVCSLSNSGEYSELEYFYDDTAVVAIKQKLWIEVYVERNFILHHTKDGLIIEETLPDNSHIRIYPAK